MIQPTSLQAYNQIKPTLSYRQAQVLEYLKTYGSSTNSEIARALGRPINCITGRMREVVKKGLVVKIDKRRCFVTSYMAITWGLSDHPPVQKQFPFAGGGVG